MELKIELHIYEDRQKLSRQDSELLDAAEKALEKAYAPYSNYSVGAALLLAGGRVVTGNNQENAAYPSGLCAERVAIFSAGAQFPEEKIESIAIATRSGVDEGNPAAPCGACRQVLVEYEARQVAPIRIIMGGSEKRIIVAASAADLLPLCFTWNVLKKH